MKAILLFIVLCAGTRVGAQQISWYTAEGADYYQVSRCAPGSEVAFYSATNGGRHLGGRLAGEDGTVTVPGSKIFRPQMALNTGRGGNRQVTFTGSREFAIASPAVQGSGHMAVITWTGSATDHGDISFQVLRSEDGVHYRPVNHTKARSGDDVSPYMYTEARTGAAVLYKLAVISGLRGLRYTTQPMLLAGLSGITVFPTSITDNLYIALPSVADGANYTIVNSEGKKVDGGRLTAIQSPISLNRFAPGTYVVTVRCGAEQQVAKVVKL